jgi:SAM-dependent methyltransferase
VRRWKKMSPISDARAAEFYAQTYDESVQDWPGEIEFYQGLASELKDRGEDLLELACGTGRVAIRLAQEGTKVVGLDLSTKMLEVATAKSKDIPDIKLVEGDMRAFDLEATFGLILIPGHAFHNLTTPEDQVACLECVRRHLKPGGIFVLHLDHQDVSWLGELLGEKGGLLEPAEQFIHARTGHQVRASRSWSYEPATQTAVSVTAWEAVTADGEVVDHWQTEPLRMHCFFRYEVEHMLVRTGFSVEALYGDFYCNALEDKSSEMVWVAKLQ